MDVSSKVTVDEVNAFLAEHLPFSQRFGFVCERLALDEAVIRWRYDEGWTRPGGEESFVCGPVMMTMVDVSMYSAIFTRAGFVPLALTNELKTTFLRPAAGGDLLCRARVLKAGRRVCYGLADIYVETDPDRLVAQGTVTYIMPD